jgi:hypothetical protein
MKNHKFLAEMMDMPARAIYLLGRRIIDEDEYRSMLSVWVQERAIRLETFLESDTDLR